MKKLISIMVASIMLCATPVYAANVDLDSMTIEELVELRNQVAEKINEKVGSDVAPIASGVYVVGKDIREGTFYISDTTLVDRYFKVFLYEDQTALEENREITGRSDTCFLEEGEDATVNLHDGMIMVIEGGNGMIQEMKPSFAP